MDSLIEEATHVLPSSSVWTTFQGVVNSLRKLVPVAADPPSSSKSSEKHCSITAFGRVIVAVGGFDDNGRTNSIYMYSSHTKLWEKAGEIPVAVDSTCTIAISNDVIIVIGGATDAASTGSCHVYKGTLILQ